MSKHARSTDCMKLGVEPMQNRTISVFTLETNIKFHTRRNTPCVASNDCCSGTLLDTLRWRHYWLVSAMDVDCEDQLLLSWFIFRSESIETVGWVGGIGEMRAKCHGFTSPPPPPHRTKIFVMGDWWHSLMRDMEKPWVFNIARCQRRNVLVPKISNYHDLLTLKSCGSGSVAQIVLIHGDSAD